MSFSDMLIHRCDIYRYTDVINKKESHFTKQDNKIIYKNVACRFIMKRSTNLLEMGHIKAITYYKLILPKNIRVENGDIIIWSSDKNTKYKIQEPYSPSNSFNVAILKKEDEV